VTVSRLISFPIHAALDLVVGLAVMAAPFALGLPVPAVMTGLVLGATIFGLGLSAGEPDARGTIPVRAHAAYDAGMAIGLLAAGLAFAIAGHGVALAFFAAAALVQLALSAFTRYSPAPAGR
jgi:hypothetical protein